MVGFVNRLRHPTRTFPRLVAKAPADWAAICPACWAILTRCGWMFVKVWSVNIKWRHDMQNRKQQSTCFFPSICVELIVNSCQWCMVFLISIRFTKYSKTSERGWVSELLLFNAKWTISALSWREQVECDEMMIISVCTSASTMKQHTTSRHVATLGHIILILRQPDISPTP